MMSQDIAYQNKDIMSKAFADNFKGKSLSVYGLNVPKIIQVLPTNLPTVEANELRIDNLFLLEDGTIAIIDYESTYLEENKTKYLNYITKVIILPLTYKTLERKQVSLKDTISLAKTITDESTMVFVLSGILVFTDKIIDKETAKQVKEWIGMTKVARLFEEEKQKEIEEVKEQTEKEMAKGFVINLLKDGMSEEKIVTLVPQVSLNDVRELAKSL